MNFSKMANGRGQKNIAKAVKGLRDLVFPDLCPGCDEQEKWADSQFCLFCISDLPYISENEAQKALIGKDDFFGKETEIYSLFYYQSTGIVRNLLHKIKYNHRRQLASELGYLLGQKLRIEITKNTILVPVPIHRKRLIQRGYNQAGELATGLTRCLKAAKTKIIVKTKHTHTFTQQSKRQRVSQHDDIYENNGNFPPETDKIILVDDVITTGTTMRLCTQAIRTIWKGPIAYVSLAITI